MKTTKYIAVFSRYSVFYGYPGAYSEPCQRSAMELFAKIING